MIWSNEFVKLDKSVHDRVSFDCGEIELNQFIQEYADRHMRIGISNTMVLPASKSLPGGKYPICAFYTITPGQIARETLPEQLKKKLPFYPVPIFLIAQMAVHSKCQGQGLGKITLIKALEYLWGINKDISAYAVIVDCLNTDVVNFYLQFEFQALNHDAGQTRMFLPMKTVGGLFST